MSLPHKIHTKHINSCKLYAIYSNFWTTWNCQQQKKRTLVLGYMWPVFFGTMVFFEVLAWYHTVPWYKPSDIIMLLVWKCKVTLETYSKHLRKCGCLHIEKFYGYSQPVLSARSWNICTRPDWEAPMLKSGRDQKESRVKNGPNFHNLPLRLW